MTAPVTVGLAVLGRRSRTALQSVVTGLLDRDIPVVVAGALDELSDDEAALLHRPDGDYPVHIPVTGALSIDVPRNDIRPHAQRAIDTLATAGADLIAVLCAADLGRFTAPVPLVEPPTLVPAFTASVITEGSIDVVVPHPGQREHAAKHWSHAGFSPRVSAVAPNRDDTAVHLAEISRSARESNSRAIVLDCFGFGAAEAHAAAASRLPVISARSVTGHAVAALVTPI
ncbi:hypothetical protein BVC93_03855 [Mycobacterium sp. MS1601]|uniref:AroM family protein n=1 Tax=Mycobacterium sp. MS1601 TaxID=1936029 RepID=UPI000979476C|nr:AroM family protein [Mycobacterium sp. MS1601]AQA01708.1 hypothetical protein BVC93_03855 [Mycobacterium sp. MS1601]